jgi:hypothetical protein
MERRAEAGDCSVGSGAVVRDVARQADVLREAGRLVMWQNRARVDRDANPHAILADVDYRPAQPALWPRYGVLRRGRMPATAVEAAPRVSVTPLHDGVG